MVSSNMSELGHIKKLYKLVLPKDIQQSEKRIMSCYIRVEDTIPNIIDKVYVMQKDIGNINGIDSNEKKKHTSKRLKNENSRETKSKSTIKKN